MSNPLTLVSAMNAKDWLDLGIAISLAALSIDRWIRGRETAENRSSYDIRSHKEHIERLEKEIKDECRKLSVRIRDEIDRVWAEFDRIHAKASDMSAEWQTKGGAFSLKIAILEERLKNYDSRLVELTKILERRSSSRGSRDS